jgi:hypothetical protein
VRITPTPCIHASFHSSSQLLPSIASEHAVDKISQWAPVILSTGKTVLVDEKDVVLEASVEMGFETELADDWVVVAVDVGVNTIHSLEDLTDHAWEGLGEWDTCCMSVMINPTVWAAPTDSTGEYSLVVNVALNPAHQVFDVCRGRHLRGTFVVLRILPEVFELIRRLHLGARLR